MLNGQEERGRWSQMAWLQSPDLLPPWVGLCPLWALAQPPVGWEEAAHPLGYVTWQKSLHPLGASVSRL